MSEHEQAELDDVPDELTSESLHVQMQDFLGFQVGREIYALPIVAVHELTRVPTITEVPRGPKEVLGVISVRGHVTTLFDMSRMLGMPETTPTDASRVLLVRRDEETLGLLVDRVLRVYRLAAEEIESEPGLTQELASYVVGIARPRESRAVRERRSATRSSGEVLILLDLDQMLEFRGRSQ